MLLALLQSNRSNILLNKKLKNVFAAVFVSNQYLMENNKNININITNRNSNSNSNSTTNLDRLPTRTKKITWIDENKGEVVYLPSGRVKGFCYSLKYVVLWELISCLSKLVNSPPWSQCNDLDILDKMTSGALRSTLYLEPEMSHENIDKILLLIIARTKLYLTNIVSNRNDTDNFLFLAKLGFTTNWKRDCCICLRATMETFPSRDDTTDIIVFRPCGHISCKNPCFKELTIKHNLFRPRLLDGCNVIHPITGYDSIIETEYECPCCAQNVVSVFKPESVMSEFQPLYLAIPPAYKEDIESLVNEIMANH